MEMSVKFTCNKKVNYMCIYRKHFSLDKMFFHLHSMNVIIIFLKSNYKRRSILPEHVLIIRIISFINLIVAYFWKPYYKNLQ